MTDIKKNPVALLLVAVLVGVVLWLVVALVWPIVKLVLMVIGLVTIAKWVFEALAD